MTQDHLEVSGVFPASPEAVYDAFLDGSKHTAMTGAPATASAEVGGRFSAWDGYIEGENVQLDRPRRILQRWRAADFPDGAPASLLQITLESEGSGTRVLIRHAELPEGTAGRFTEGWTKFYFAPMSVYFGETPDSDDDELDLADEEVAEVVDEDDEEAVSADDATARRDTGAAPVVDTTESLREAARAEDEDEEEESSERAEVDGAIRSLWEASATGDVDVASDDSGAVRVAPHDRDDEDADEEEDDEDDDDEEDDAVDEVDDTRTTLRAPAHAEWAPGHEPTGIKALASRARRGLKKLVGVDTHGEDDPETIDVGSIPSPSQLARKVRPAAAKKAAPKKAAKKAAPKKAAKKAAPKKAAKKAAPKKAAKKAAPKKAAKKAAPKKAAPKKAAKKAAPKKAANKAAPKKAAPKKAAPKKAAAKKSAKKRSKR